MAEVTVKAYEIGVKSRPEFGQTVYAITAGKAKYSYLLDVQDCWPDVQFKDLTCRSLGTCFSSGEDFKRTARKRGVEFAEIGMRVEVDGEPGVIVGKNDSANFDVLFTGPKHRGNTLNCHPNWKFKYFAADGSLIKEF
jgi:hypothetical protein